MKVVNAATAGTRDLTKDALMTGGSVEATFLIRPPDVAKEIGMGIMKFAPGARTKFHTHTSEQVLYCLEGKGVVATEQEEITITPGTLALFPSGENHWHGASKDSSVSLLTIAPPHKTNY
jgi:quercetin dioxygenase-like cupin family protein